MGEWSKLDRAIYAAEQEEMKRAGLKEDMIESYFENRRRRELSRKNVKDMSWDEVYLLDEMRKGDNMPATNPQMGTQSLEDQKRQAYQLISQIRSHPNCSDDIAAQMEKVEIMINSLELTDTTNTQEKPEEISNDPEVSVSKSYPMEIFKSENKNIIKGYASVDITDKKGDRVPMAILKKALSTYLQHGSILLNHRPRPIGKIISHDFRRNFNGNEGLYIECELYPGNEDVLEAIEKRILKGFSIGGTATRSDEKCDTIKCWKEIKNLSLFEISLCEEPMNQESVLER